MIPPTSIDGTDITGATIDGQDVEEITVDGQTVFTAGPDVVFTESWEGAYPGNWQGATGEYNQVSTDPFDGSLHLERNTITNNHIYIDISNTGVTQSGGYQLRIYKNKNNVSFGEGGPAIYNANGDGYIFRDNGVDANFQFVNNFSNGSQITEYKSSSLNVPASGYYYTQITVSGSNFQIEYFDTSDTLIDGPFNVSDNSRTGVDQFIGFSNARSGARTDLVQLIDTS